ncbi:MAG: P-II family nitrogen regulator [Actinomycetota bacterium]|jgi:nitrogen regulatory protein P-II 1
MTVMLVTAIIKPQMLEPVKDAVREAGVQGMTVTEVRGFGRQGGHSETYRGVEYTVDLIPKLRIEVLCPLDQAEMVMTVVQKAAYTGKIGDGKIWATDVNRLLRIRTGEMGTEAV